MSWRDMFKPGRVTETRVYVSRRKLSREEEDALFRGLDEASEKMDEAFAAMSKAFRSVR